MDTAGAPLVSFDAEPAPEPAGRARALEAAPLCAILRPARDAIDPLLFEWTRLASEASEPNPYCEPWFLRAALRHLAPEKDIRLLEVRSGPFLIGLLPLAVARRYGRLPVRNVQNWMHHHSFLGTPLIRAGQEQRFWSAALTALDEENWASGFLHINGLVEGGPVHSGLAAAATGRSCDVVHRCERALLESDLAPEPYYEATVRKKKRKELKRLRNRLAELGTVNVAALERRDQLDDWCDSFLALERSGWKGEEGSALASRTGTETFFREAVSGAFAAGRLDFLRLDLDGKPLAMLVNFVTPPGAFSFKIAFDEDYARFSPGVLIEIENLRILDRQEVAWMDSCAAENHPMINSLWGERRSLVRVTVPFARRRSRALFRLCRQGEDAWAALKRLGARRTAETEAADD